MLDNQDPSDRPRFRSLSGFRPTISAFEPLPVSNLWLRLEAKASCRTLKFRPLGPMTPFVPPACLWPGSKNCWKTWISAAIETMLGDFCRRLAGVLTSLQTCRIK